MNRILLYTLLLMAASTCSCRRSASAGKDGYVAYPEIESLAQTIKNADAYSDSRQEEIDSMKREAFSKTGVAKWQALIDISARYRQMNADSAIYYAHKALTEANPGISEEMSTIGFITYANALSTSGLFSPAIHILDSISGRLGSLNSKIEYWKSQRILSSYMLAFMEHQGLYANAFKKKYIECDDSLLNHLPKSDPFYKFIYCERLVTDNRFDEAMKNLRDLLATTPKDDNIYGMGAYQLAEVHRHKGDFINYTRYLALSSESDIRSGVKEGVALPTLANWLYNHGDIDNAFTFINFALDEANTGNVRMRTVTIASLMPLIDRAYRKKIDNSKDTILGYLIVTTILLTVAAALSAWLIRTIHRNKANELRLAQSSKILEAYVGNFIGLCSNYATRLSQLGKLVTRKIAAGQTDELQKLVGSGRFSEEDNEEFYRLIDKAILDIFPDFVENINTLLLPDKKIILKQGENLTPELRIYAFIRLGVDQGAKIAQILQYSVNTVYSYRNRMRNRAINRDTFDSDVKDLDKRHNFFNILISD